MTTAVGVCRLDSLSHYRLIPAAPILPYMGPDSHSLVTQSRVASVPPLLLILHSHDGKCGWRSHF